MDNKKALTQRNSGIQKKESDMEIGLPLALKVAMNLFKPQALQQAEAAKKIIKAAGKNGATKVSIKMNSEAADMMGFEYNGARITKSNKSGTSTEVTVHFPQKR